MSGKRAKQLRRENKAMKDEVRAAIAEHGSVEVNSCSSLIEKHTIQCDGTCEKMTLDQLDLDLKDELDNWNTVGMDPAHVRHDAFSMENQILGVVEVLTSILGVDMKELDRAFKEATLKRLVTIREANEDNVRKARLAATSGPTLVGPNGKPLIQ